MKKSTHPVTHRIQELRQARGWSQEQLGTVVGLSKFTISRIEGGKQDLDLPTAQKIADAFNVTLAAVLGIETAGGSGGFSEDVTPYVTQPNDPQLGANEDRYQVQTNVCEHAGARRGDVLVVDTSPYAAAHVEPLDIVVACYQHPELPDTRILLLRQFVPPGLLITNARDNTRSIDIAREPVRILAVMKSVRRPVRIGHN